MRLHSVLVDGRRTFGAHPPSRRRAAPRRPGAPSPRTGSVRRPHRPTMYREARSLPTLRAASKERDRRHGRSRIEEESEVRSGNGRVRGFSNLGTVIAGPGEPLSLAEAGQRLRQAGTEPFERNAKWRAVRVPARTSIVTPPSGSRAPSCAATHSPQAARQAGGCSLRKTSSGPTTSSGWSSPYLALRTNQGTCMRSARSRAFSNPVPRQRSRAAAGPPPCGLSTPRGAA
jgi:hypothetical protein